MDNNPARCPGCRAALHFSFQDEVNERPVYQCTSVGVPRNVEAVLTSNNGRTQELVKFASSTLDHSDRFYMRFDGQTLRVNPVRLNRGQNEALLKRKGYPFEKDEITRRIIVPTCWTTARA